MSVTNLKQYREAKEQKVVKADVDNGYYRIANELGLALCKAHLNGQESRFVFAIMQKTFGWQKSMDWVCNDQISELTGIQLCNISRIKKRLIDRKIITVLGRKIGVNSCVSEWDLGLKPRKQNSSIGLNDSSIERADSSIELNNSSIDNPQKKDTITKENTPGETSFPQSSESQNLGIELPPQETPVPNQPKKQKANKIDFTKLASAYHEILDDMPNVLLPLSDKRKNKIKTLSKKYGLSNERWQAYFEYVAENCQWMTEQRENLQTGKVWRKKNLDYLITEDCYTAVKEQRANDH